MPSSRYWEGVNRFPGLSGRRVWLGLLRCRHDWKSETPGETFAGRLAFIVLPAVATSIAWLVAVSFQRLGEPLGELLEAVGEHVAGEFEGGVVLFVGDGRDAAGVQQQLVADMQQFVVTVGGQVDVVAAGQNVVFAFHGGAPGVAARVLRGCARQCVIGRGVAYAVASGSGVCPVTVGLRAGLAVVRPIERSGRGVGVAARGWVHAVCFVVAMINSV